ncbi:ATP-binding protein [Butyrivibrio sp. MC2013]|uniref:ATP-binding protein n=1 Tax=Butyrivibrio sp. MC2013 TaxID=1280686 RepID=UPI000412A409|nr:ATP-binding protein [Butyrivibrio sp. MC2013]
MDKAKRGFKLNIRAISAGGFFFLVFLVYVMVLGRQISRQNQTRSYEFDVVNFDNGWEMEYPNGSRMPVMVPSRIYTRDGSTRIVNRLPENLGRDTWLSVFGCVQEVTIYVDGKVRTEYSIRPGKRGIGSRTSPTAYIFAELYDEDAGKEVMIETMSDSIFSGTLGDVYLGTQAGIWKMYSEEHFSTTLISMILAVIAVTTLIIALYVYIRSGRAEDFLYISLGFSATIIWRVLSSPNNNTFMQLEVRDLGGSFEAAFQCLVFIGIPFLCFADVIQEKRYHRAYSGSVAIYSVWGIVLSILNYAGIAYFAGVIMLILMPIVLTVVTITVCTVLDARKGLVRRYYIIAWGFAFFVLTVVLELLRQSVRFFAPLQEIYGYGLLGLMLAVVFSAVNDMIGAQNAKLIAERADEKKSDFMTLMSHRIRTPVNTISGMSQIIEKKTSEPVIREYAYSIRNAVRVLMSLIEDMLDAGRAEKGELSIKRRQYAIRDVLEDCLGLLKTTAGRKGLELETLIDQNLPSILEGDDVRIRQVITNILTNAVKYTNFGKVTFVMSGERSGENTIILTVKVKDTGIGIKEEDLGEIFSSYNRADEGGVRHIEGTGLGLFITKRLVDLMEGDISVKSKYMEGSTFTIRLPQRIIDIKPIGDMDVDWRKKETGAALTPHLRAPDARILVVDDNNMNLEVFAGLLEDSQITIDKAGGGQEAIDMASWAKYDLIFMDHMMPHPDGIEAFHKIRDDLDSPNMNTPFIALTANAVPGARQMYLEEGFAEYLSKPVDFDTLEKALLSFLPDDKKILTY